MKKESKVISDSHVKKAEAKKESTVISENIESRVKKAKAKLDVDNEMITDEERKQRLEELEKCTRAIFFGAELARRRNVAGKTQAELGRDIGKSESFVRKVEAAEIQFSASKKSRQTLNKIIESVSGWSQKQAYNMLQLNVKPSENIMTLKKAEKEMSTALLDSANVNEFVSSVLYVRTKFKADHRRGSLGELRKSQMIADIFLEVRNYTALEYATAFLKLAMYSSNLKQSQWERILRAQINPDIEGVMNLYKALESIVAEKQDIAKQNSKREVKNAEKTKAEIAQITPESEKDREENKKKSFRMSSLEDIRKLTCEDRTIHLDEVIKELNREIKNKEEESEYLKNLKEGHENERKKAIKKNRSRNPKSSQLRSDASPNKIIDK